MSYSLIEFLPTNPRLIIRGQEINLALITLKIENLFTIKYGSLLKVFEAVEKEPVEIIEVIWELMLDKKNFNNNFSLFSSFVVSVEKDLPTISKSMNECLREAVTKSVPLIKNRKRQLEINEITGTGKESGPCYATYYDKMAKRYGLSIDDFYQMTLRQLHLLLKVSDDEGYKELEVQAALQGKKLKPKIEFTDITEEQEESNEQHAAEALAELRKKYEENRDK